MKSVDEIKKNPHGLFYEIYGISKHEFMAISHEMMEIVWKIFEIDGENATKGAVTILEEVLYLDNYTSEQLLRLAVFFRNLCWYFESLFLEALEKIVENPEVGKTILKSVVANYETICPVTGEKVMRNVCTFCPNEPSCPAYRW